MKTKGYVIEVFLKKTSDGRKEVHYDMAVTDKRNNGLWCGGNQMTVFKTKEEAKGAIRKSAIYAKRAKLDWDNFDYMIWELL